MKLDLAILALVAGTTIARTFQHVCKPANGSGLSFSGYRVDIQYSLTLQQEFHLYLCSEGKVTMDIVMNQTATEESSIIPWGKQVCDNRVDSSRCFILARRHLYKNRTFPIYIPGTIIGGIFAGNIPILPLVALDIWLNQWLEIKGGFRKVVYHFPILSTPSWESQEHPQNMLGPKENKELWAKDLVPKEKYNTHRNEVSMLQLRKSYATVSEKIYNLAETKRLSILNMAGKRFNPVTNFFLLLRVLSKEAFFGLVSEIDKLYNTLATH